MECLDGRSRRRSVEARLELSILLRTRSNYVRHIQPIPSSNCSSKALASACVWQSGDFQLCHYPWDGPRRIHKPRSLGATIAIERIFRPHSSLAHLTVLNTSFQTTTMHFNLSVLAAALGLASSASFAMAADCYTLSGCRQCASKSDMYKAREELCNTDKWKNSSVFNWGYATVNLDGRFHTQQSCWDGFEDIINQCYGQRNGGVVSRKCSVLSMVYCPGDGQRLIHSLQ